MPPKFNRKRKKGDRDRRSGEGGGERVAPAHDRSKKRRQWGPPGGDGYGASLAGYSGRGIFMTCVRGKERKAANEFVDILTDVAGRVYPGLDLRALPVVKPEGKTPAAEAEEELDEDAMDDLRNGGGGGGEGEGENTASAAPHDDEEGGDDDDDDANEEEDQSAPSPEPEPAATTSDHGDDIGSELRAELAALRQSGAQSFGKQRRQPQQKDSAKQTAPAFRYIDLGTECLTFIATHPHLDPFALCTAFLKEVEATGEARSRFISRLTPIAGLCNASLSDVSSLAARVLQPFFPPDQNGTFKIETRMRSHNTMKRLDVIDVVAAGIPRGTGQGGEAGKGKGEYRADLKNPTHWVIVEVYKSRAALGVVHDFHRFCKMNPLELANSVKMRRAEGAGTGGQPQGEGSGSGSGSRVAAATASKEKEEEGGEGGDVQAQAQAQAEEA